MEEKGKPPKYAVRLLILIISIGVVFFGGLQLFVPEGSKLTGSYDAKSLLYIAAAPVAYRGADSCGATDCHQSVVKKWSEGAHGAHREQSKCEVCHGPQGDHPAKGQKMLKVRGDGDIVQLCLTCHRKMKARSTTGQPQIVPQQHPYPHEGVLKCTQCHDPHSPGFSSPARAQQSSAETAESTIGNGGENGKPQGVSLAENCFGCHGPSGRGGFAPVLAGQSYDVLKEKLTKFRSGELTSAIMNPIASQIKDEDIEVLAHYFASRS
ncbi:MAG: c-type cytochrome [Gammaproteobacteria bacterium]